ncbi:hypothetical protein B484DRAFT_451538 [Ochromonadaceae sp. CCMP2298]|nr:hypothetical protein B484DRAFT_451538 [Ochromonadaceae sp. CCMP2298]
MPIVLDMNRAPHLDKFLQFLNAGGAGEHARITMDQWDSFLQFNLHVQADLSNFEDDGACKCGHAVTEAYMHICTSSYAHIHTCQCTHTYIHIRT